MRFTIGSIAVLGLCITPFDLGKPAAGIPACVAPVKAAEPDAARAAESQTAAEPDERAVYGIERRAPWTTSRITGSPEPPPPYAIQRAFPNLQFDELVDMAVAPGSDRLFAVELKGKIFSFPNDQDCRRPDLFIDLAREIEDFFRVYGIAFHPDFEQNGYVYVCYVLKAGLPDGTRVSRFEVSRTDPPRCDPASETILITWLSGGHNGGCLKFGPDGYLYISSGDATSPSPPDKLDVGQDIGNLLSSVLRIDVDRSADGKPYRVPPDNPFVDHAGACPEVWAYGFRNPWKMSFDRATGDLWVGDVGWEMWEMIYRIERGGNYGWSIVEGPQSVRPNAPRGPTPILPPTVAHDHTESRSITGGIVYRGQRLKDLIGAYIYGDYVTGKIWGLKFDGREVVWQQELVDTPLQIICFGEDPAGEMYVLGHQEGTFHRLVPNPAQEANQNFPQTLSETGLFENVLEHAPAAGVIPYSINAQPWEDGAKAERWIAVPGAPTLDVYREQNVQLGVVRGAWNYPSDTVFAKTLSLEMQPGEPSSRRRIETQILHRNGQTWRAYTYAWNDEQTDARLVPAEGSEAVLTIADPQAPGSRRRHTWRFSSRTECLVCHTTRGGSIYGFNPLQLDKTHDYGRTPADQLATLVHVGLFEQPAQPKSPPLVDPHDESADLDGRARSYLHVNCAQCHRRGGGGTAKFELLRELPIEKLLLLGERPLQGDFGIPGAEVVAAGDPYRSVLLYRMAKLGRGRMPHAGSSVVDTAGVDLIHRWIESLPAETSAARDTGGESGRDTNGDVPAVDVSQARQVEAAALRKLHSAREESARLEAIDELLASTSGALRLLRAIDLQQLPAETVAQAIARGAAHPQGAVRDLFERFIPEEDRVQRLGNNIRPDDILSLRGNAERGREFYFQAEGVQCKNCHRIGQSGKELGPDLTNIGRTNTREQLLESLLEPSKKIDPKYASYLVETNRGRIHTGLLVRQTEEEVVLRDVDHKEIRIPAGEIEELVKQQKSLMPDLLLRDLTAQQAADLLEFLSSLK